MSKTDKAAPAEVPVSSLFAPIPGFNSAVEINHADPDMPARQIDYNGDTDNGLASQRSKHCVRPHDQSTTHNLPLGTGLSLRVPMAGQCENDQFPLSTNNFGKQRR